MKALERVVPGLVVAAEKNDILHNLLQGTLPTLAVQIFMAVLPLIFDGKLLLLFLVRHYSQHHSLTVYYFSFRYRSRPKSA